VHCGALRARFTNSLHLHKLSFGGEKLAVKRHGQFFFEAYVITFAFVGVSLSEATI